MALTVCIGVCPGTGGTDDRKVGSPTVTISSDIATLSVAQTGALIGPGTCIYAKVGVTPYYYYVSEVLSDTTFRVTLDGAVPSSGTATVQKIYFPYASLSAAESAIQTAIVNTSLTSKDVQVFIYLYGADTGGVTVDGYTTDATRNINIVAASAAQTLDGSEWRWQGVPDDTKAKAGGSLVLSDPYTTVDGLQIQYNGEGILLDAASCVARNCFIRCGSSPTSTATGVNAARTAGTGGLVENCVITGYTGSSGGGIKVLTANAVKIYHCTIHGNRLGIVGSASNSTATVVNCLVFNNTTNDWYYMSSTQPTCYSNCSDDTPLGSNGIDASPGSVEASDWALLVKDYANGDVRPLNAYSPIYRAGRGWEADNTLPTTDVKGDSRHLTTPSIGAYERSVDGKGYGQMDIWVRVSETFKKLITGYVLSGGIWKPLRSVYVLVNGVWKQIYVLSVVGHVLNPSFELWDGTALRYFTLAGAGATATKDTSDYYADGTSVCLVRGSTGGMLYQDVHAEEGLSYWQGRKVHADVMCKADDPSTVCVRIEDGVGSSTHTHHSGSGEWEKLEAEITVSASATMVRVVLDAGGGVAGKSARFDLLNLYVV
jgi:hypothetical protein